MKWLIFSFLALGFLTVSFANPKPQNEEYGLVDDGGDDGFDDYDDIINVEDDEIEKDEDLEEYRKFREF